MTATMVETPDLTAMAYEVPDSALSHCWCGWRFHLLIRSLSFSPVVEEMTAMARLAVVVTTTVHQAAAVTAMAEMIPMVYGSLGPC